jgi:hypothetical protein
MVVCSMDVLSMGVHCVGVERARASNVDFSSAVKSLTLDA